MARRISTAVLAISLLTVGHGLSASAQPETSPPPLFGPRTSVAGTTQTPPAASMAQAEDPDDATCSRGFIGFEQFPDQTNLSAQTFPGVQFTTTGGFTWLVGDFATGRYNGKYPSGAYTSQGTHWAWLGAAQGSGRIDLVQGRARFFSLLVSAASPVHLEAYAANGTLLQTASSPRDNTHTGTMDHLVIERDQADIAYLIVHDSGNFFLIDSVCTDAPGIPPATVTPKYVALGDSFSSGEGVEPFFEPGNDCHRSMAAYATKVETPGITGASQYDLMQAGALDAEWGFQACSGATTDHLLSSGHHGDPLPQLALDRSADTGNANDLPVDGETTLVTLTIGGNDMNFVGVLDHCFYSANCTAGAFGGYANLDAYATARLGELSAKLDAVYQRIRTQAFQARVLVLGYPNLFPLTPKEQNCLNLSQKTNPFNGKTFGWSQIEQTWFRIATAKLNKLILDRSVAHGMEFIRVDGLFTGHEPCGRNGEWVHGLSLSFTEGNNVDRRSFHPNGCGQAALAALVNLRLNGHLDSVCGS